MGIFRHHNKGKVVHIMEEYQVINKIKKLQQIKPRKNWVVFSENEILGPELKEKTPLFSWFILPFRKPVLVFSSILLIAIALTGVFLYLNSQTPSPILVSEEQNETEILSSLEGLGKNLKEIKLSLDNLKNVKDQNQALVMTAIVKATAKEGVRMVNDIKDSQRSLSKEVLASLGEVEGLSGELTEASNDLQKEIFEDYLEFLKQRTLSDEDQVRLQKVEQYYNEGREADAFLLITLIGKTN